MATRKADVAELIAMRLSLEAERAGQPRPHCDRKPKGPDIWRRLLELSHDSDANVRQWVVERVRDGSPVRWRRVIVGRLMVLSEDSDAKVRRCAKQALDSYRSAAQLDFFASATEAIASK